MADDGDKLAARIAAVLPGLAPEGTAAVWLFGSHAAGRAHRDSDVDLGVLFDRARLPGPAERFRARLRLGARLAEALGRDDLDLVVLNDAPPLLARRIVTEGVPLYIADSVAEHAFRRDVQLRAADLEPFLRRARARKLAVLAGS